MDVTHSNTPCDAPCAHLMTTPLPFHWHFIREDVRLTFNEPLFDRAISFVRPSILTTETRQRLSRLRTAPNCRG